MPITASDRDLMIRTVVSESGDEPPVGQAGVAHVILNRLLTPDKYGDSVGGVVKRRGAFEPWGLPKEHPNNPMRVDPNSAAYRQAALIVDGVLSGQVKDPTGGATHFLQPEIVTSRVQSGQLKEWPKWAQAETVQLGRHSFYRPDGAPPNADPNYSDDAILRRYSPVQPSAAPGAVPAAAGGGDPRYSDEAILGRYGGGKTAAAPPVAAPSVAAPADLGPDAIPLPPRDGVPQWTTQAKFDADVAKAKEDRKNAPSEIGKVRDAVAAFPQRAGSAIKDNFLAGAGTVGNTFSDIQAGRPATAVGDLVMGGLGMAGAIPSGILQEGVSRPVTEVTGNPNIGDAAGTVAGLMAPIPKVAPQGAALSTASKINSMRGSVRGLDEIVNSIPQEKLPGVIKRLESNPSLTLADLVPEIQIKTQGLAATPGKWSGLLKDFTEQRAADASAAVNHAVNDMGVSDSAYNVLNGIIQRAKTTGETAIQPALEGAAPVPIKPILKALDRQIGSPEAIAGDTPRIPLTPTQIKLLNLRQDITSGEMAPINERVGLSIGGINDAIKSGTLGPDRLADFTEARRLLNSARRGLTSEEDLTSGLAALAKKQKTVGPIDAALKMVTKGPVEVRGADWLHGVQSRLREQASTLQNSSGGSDRLMAGDLFDARGHIVEAIDKASGGTYKPALSQYRDDKQVREAFGRGLAFGKTRQGEAGILEDSPAAWREWKANASPDEVDATRAGVLANLQQSVAQMHQAWVLPEGSRPPIPKIDGYSADRLEVLFGKDKADQLLSRLQDEHLKAQTNVKLFGGSQTAMRTLGAEAMKVREPGATPSHLPSLGTLLGGIGLELGGMHGAGTLAAAAAGGMGGVRLARHGAQVLGQKSDITRNKTFAEWASATGEKRDDLLDILRSRIETPRSPYKIGNLLSSPAISALPR